MKHIISILVVALVLSGCATTPAHSGAWSAQDFAKASDPEMEEIAAVCLRESFKRARSDRPPTVYYIYVRGADWRKVVARARIEAPGVILRGPQDYFWSDEGYRDRETGLRAYSIGIEKEPTKPGETRVFLTWSAGTGQGFSSRFYRFEKKNGAWVIVETIQGPVS